MWRKLHSLLALTALILLVPVTLSGVALSIYPVLDALAPEVQAAHGINVAELADRVRAALPEVDKLERTPSGSIIATYADDSGLPHQGYVDVETGTILRPVAQGGSFFEVLKTFHRSLFLGDSGRIVVGIGAGLMMLLAISGLTLLVVRMGGIRRIFATPRGSWSARTHAVLSRLALLPLLVSSLTGIYILLTAFDVISVSEADPAVYPESAQGLPPATPGSLHGLVAIPLSDLRVLTFPYPDDTFDVFTAETSTALVMVDQLTGDVLERVDRTPSEMVYEWFYAIHSGQGMAWLGVVFGLAALMVPILGFTGVVVWWRRTRSNKPRIKGSKPAALADTIVLVGSEGGSTWGFAASLFRELTAAGHKVHVASMNAFRPHHARARNVLLLAATYGNGGAPTSAGRFVAKFADMGAGAPCSYAVLGFGDRAFPHYCKFAKDLDADLAKHGWKRLLDVSFINRQSSQAFKTWGTELAGALGTSLSLSHEVQLPPTGTMVLTGRTDFGEAVSAPTAILTFQDGQPQPRSVRPNFAPGDLLAVVPPGSKVPRYYSISSLPSDSDIEICVRLLPGGECSSLLHALAPGDTIACFVKSNPDFTLKAGRRPVIMIGAGTGIAPFVGMVRENARRRPIQLFFGARDPVSDFLYEDVLVQCLADGRLASLTTAFSRVGDRAYVQDRVREHAPAIADMLRGGAMVMVCGGEAMAQGVKLELEAILTQVGLSLAQLKSRGLYLEDIF